MKKTLITGGAGFLGSHLCERLLARGDNVTCLDNFSTGDFGNIEGLLEQPMFNVITQDVVELVRYRSRSDLQPCLSSLSDTLSE